MALDVPVSVYVSRLVLLGTSDLNLLETPLRQIDVARSEVAAEIGVPQTERGGQSSDLRIVVGSRVTDNFDNPVVLGVPYSGVAVARHLVISLGDRGSDLMRVEITAGLSVNETDGVAVAREAERLLGIVFDFCPVGIEEPVIVRVLVMIASNLLLTRPLGVSLDMRMQKTTP